MWAINSNRPPSDSTNRLSVLICMSSWRSIFDKHGCETPSNSARLLLRLSRVLTPLR
jgi:hypothetical protein